MELMGYLDELPIDKNCDLSYRRMTFDGSNYYFLSVCEEKIVITDLDFNVICCVDVCREYTCICYDCSENCFWAAAKNCFNAIYKLNSELKEVDCLDICDMKKIGGIITGITYNYCSDSLLISLNNCVAEYEKTTKCFTVKKSFPKTWINSILFLCPGYVVTVIKDQKQFLMFLDCNNTIIHQICVDSGYFVKDIIINYDNEEHIALEFFAVKDRRYSYIIRHSLNHNCLEFSSCCYEICDRYCYNNSDCICECQNDNYDILNTISVIKNTVSHLLELEEKNIQNYLLSEDIQKLLFANNRISSILNNSLILENALFNNLSDTNLTQDNNVDIEEIFDTDIINNIIDNINSGEGIAENK